MAHIPGVLRVTLDLEDRIVKEIEYYSRLLNVHPDEVVNDGLKFLFKFIDKIGVKEGKRVLNG